MAFVLQIEELLAEVSPQHPCGVAGDPATDAQLSLLPRAVKKATDTDYPRLARAAEGLFRGGEIPDLSDPERKATVVVKPIKHLQAAMVLVLAGLKTDGLPGFAEGLKLVERLLREHWEKVYPVPDEGNPEDPYARRASILSPLSITDPAKATLQSGPVTASDSWRFEERLLKATLLDSEVHAAVSLRDCLSPWAKERKLSLPAGEDRTPEFIHEVRLGAATMRPQQVESLQAAVEAVKGIEDIFKNAPVTTKPKLGYLTRLLEGALAVVEDKVGDDESPGPPPIMAEDDVEGGGARVTPPTKAPSASLPATSSPPVSAANHQEMVRKLREEAIRKLSEAADYFRRNEPASPIPGMIDRVKRLAGLDFLGALQELGLGEPAVTEFRKLAGIRDESAQKTAAGAAETK